MPCAIEEVVRRTFQLINTFETEPSDGRKIQVIHELLRQLYKEEARLSRREVDCHRCCADLPRDSQMSEDMPK